MNTGMISDYTLMRSYSLGKSVMPPLPMEDLNKPLQIFKNTLYNIHT